MTAVWALLPLRLFLGATFAYAGIQKLSDGGYLHAGAPTYIGTQLEGFARDAPAGWVLDKFAPWPVGAGVGVAVAEIAIGIAVLLGVWVRMAAACGLGLNLLLFLTATWHTSPYFLGSDIVFVFAWLPFVLLSESEQPVAAPTTMTGVSRRDVLARMAGATAALAGGAFLLRGAYTPPARARARAPAGRPLAAAADVEAGAPLQVSAAGGPALLVRGDDGAIHCFSAICTHAGCEVAPRGDVLACPCHGARFDAATGEVVGGPAPRPLESIPVREQSGQIYAATG
jgi:thiosulfate dehydrogenase [quinone] large subunit